MAACVCVIDGLHCVDYGADIDCGVKYQLFSSSSPIYRVIASPDGQLIGCLTSWPRKEVRVWNGSSNSEVLAWPGRLLYAGLQ